ncbi:hypothetical protein [Pseudonocardia sp. TRM90224]|uniref:hypothetical protein n=1 Tax=Pseudonocardia sp. TRM90224 TaxID=2812678 RepID=UPI001E4152BC|nr:hypothetical protein [Pseudonocardia sp. TRM90224]
MHAFDLITLDTIAKQACELQGAAEAVLTACGADHEPDAQLARAGGRVAGEFHRLHAWLLDLDVEPPLRPLRDELAAAIMHHCQVVHVSIRLAFPTYRIDPTGHRRTVLELGDRGAHLRSLAATIARRRGDG